VDDGCDRLEWQSSLKASFKFSASAWRRESFDVAVIFSLSFETGLANRYHTYQANIKTANANAGNAQNSIYYIKIHNIFITPPWLNWIKLPPGQKATELRKLQADSIRFSCHAPTEALITPLPSFDRK
jgi:hypothetical protein